MRITFQMGYNLDGDLDGYTYTYLCQELPLSRAWSLIRYYMKRSVP